MPRYVFFSILSFLLGDGLRFLRQLCLLHITVQLFDFEIQFKLKQLTVEI